MADFENWAGPNTSFLTAGGVGDEAGNHSGVYGTRSAKEPLGGAREMRISCRTLRPFGFCHSCGPPHYEALHRTSFAKNSVRTSDGAECGKWRRGEEQGGCGCLWIQRGLMSRLEAPSLD